MKYILASLISLLLYFLLNSQTIIYKSPFIKQETILNTINNLSKYMQVDILIIKFNNNETFLSISSNVKNILNFIKIFEKMVSIKSIDFIYQKQLIANIVFLKNSLVSIDYKNIKLNNIPNPFEYKQTKTKVNYLKNKNQFYLNNLFS